MYDRHRSLNPYKKKTKNHYVCRTSFSFDYRLKIFTDQRQNLKFYNLKERKKTRIEVLVDA